MAARLHLLGRGLEWRHILAFGLLIAVSILIKSASWQLTPQVFNDTAGYIVPAFSLLDGRGYGAQENGFRTPTYPLFLATILSTVNRTPLTECQDAHRPVCIGKAGQTAEGHTALTLIVAVQIGLGFLTMFLLYRLGYELTGNLLVALLWGASYGLNIATAFWEISILTETLTTFLLTLSVWLTSHAEKSNWPVRGALGLTLAALALCHSLFLVYWIVPAAFLFYRALRNSGKFSNALRAVTPVLGFPILALLAWSAFNYAVNGFFTPTTLSGYVSIQMVAPVAENAPPQYQEIADLYIRYRDDQIENTASWSGAIFRAWPEMMTRTGLTWSQLSRQLTALSLSLILSDPLSYADVARQGWERFWDFPFYHYDPVPPGPGQWVLGFTDSTLQSGFDLLFGLCLPVLALIWYTHQSGRASVAWPTILLTLLTVAFAAAMSSLTNFQDNGRFHSYILPLQYGVIVFTFCQIWRALAKKRIDFSPLIDTIAM